MLLGSGGNGGGSSSSSSVANAAADADADADDDPAPSPSPPPPPPCCLICLDPLTEQDFASGAAIRLECSCRGDLALRHRECATKWSEVKGDRTCDVCRSVVENLPEPPPREPTAANDGENAFHLDGVPPHLLPFVFGSVGGGSGGGNSAAVPPTMFVDGRVVSPFFAAVVAERGSGAGVAAQLLHPPPPPPLSSADAAFDFLRVAWVGAVICLLWLDLSLSESLVAGTMSAVIYTAVVRATAVAQLRQLRRELAAAAEAAAAARQAQQQQGNGGGGGGGGARR